MSPFNSAASAKVLVVKLVCTQRHDLHDIGTFKRGYIVQTTGPNLSTLAAAVHLYSQHQVLQKWLKAIWYQWYEHTAGLSTGKTTLWGAGGIITG